MTQRGKSVNRAASIRAQLLNYAKAKTFDFNNVLVRYTNERILYRLSVSEHSSSFVLKGGTLFSIWLGQPHRPTKDVDLLGEGDNNPEALKNIFETVLAIEHDDGLIFDLSTMKAAPIKEEEKYEGVRVSCIAFLEKAKIQVQIDVGFGDAVVTGSRTSLPTIIQSPNPEMYIYPMEYVISEKFEAMVSLDISNSRMKDFYDVMTLSRTSDFRGDALSAAIAATFNRRGTVIPSIAPTALTEKFFLNEDKKKQWQGFLNKIGIKDKDLTLQAVCTSIGHFVMPASKAASSNSSFRQIWPRNGPWRKS